MPLRDRLPRGAVGLVLFVASSCSLLAPTVDELAGGHGALGGGGSDESGAGGDGRGGGGSKGSLGGSSSAAAGLGSGAAAHVGGEGNTGGAISENGGSGAGTSEAGAADGGAGDGGTAGGALAIGGSLSGRGGAPTSGASGVAGSGAASGGPVGGGSCISDVTSSFAKASTLLDDFGDGAPGTRFRIDGDPITCAAESGGDLVVAFPGPVAASEYCYYESLGNYDMTCDAVTLKVPEVAGPELGVQTFLYVVNGARQLALLVENGVYFLGEVGVELKSSGRYDPAAPWWRLGERDVSGRRTIIFETSKDGSTWTQRATMDRPFALDSVRFRLGAGAYRQSSGSVRSAFACLNTQTGCD